MAYSSASAEHTTPESRQRDQWASVRLFGGISGLILVVAGALGLTVLAAKGGELTSQVGSGLAGCIVAVVGGGLLARTCFGSQRAADRTAAFMARLDADDDRLDELFGELAELRNAFTAALLGFAEDRVARERFGEVMEKFLTHEQVVDEQSAKAREDVATILHLLAKQDLDMQDIKNALVETRLEGIVIEAIRKAYALGYVDGMEDRPPRQLRSVPPFEQH